MNEPSSFQSKRIVIVGASGWLGAPLARRLSDNGHHVLALHFQHLPPMIEKRPNIQLVQADIRQPGTWQYEIKKFKPDTVVNLAAVLRTQKDQSIDDYSAVNFQGAIHVAMASGEAGAQLLHVGTCLENDDLPDGKNYAYTKTVGTRFLQSITNEAGIGLATVYGYTGYGPFYSQNEGWGVPEYRVEWLMANALRTNTPVDLTDGMQKRDFIYFRDLLSGLSYVIFKSDFNSRVYHLGSGAGTSIRNFGEAMARAFGKPVELLKFGAKEGRPGEIDYQADLTTIKELGWSPTTSLREGLSYLARDYRE